MPRLRDEVRQGKSREERPVHMEEIKRSKNLSHITPERDLAIRRRLVDQWVNPFAFPEDKPDDVEYAWIRMFFAGQQDTMTLSDCLDRGYSLVPAERHPKYAIPDLFGDRGKLAGYIERKGFLLGERPIEYAEMERAQLRKHNREVMNSLHGYTTVDPLVPVTVFNDNKIGGYGVFQDG